MIITGRSIRYMLCANTSAPSAGFALVVPGGVRRAGDGVVDHQDVEYAGDDGVDPRQLEALVGGVMNGVEGRGRGLALVVTQDRVQGLLLGLAGLLEEGGVGVGGA